jgi:hypothetical protein
MDYRSLLLDHDGAVATVRLRPISRSFGLTPPAEVHEEVGHLDEERWDDVLAVYHDDAGVPHQPDVRRCPGAAPTADRTKS